MLIQNGKQMKKLMLNGHNINKAYINGKLVFSSGVGPDPPDPPVETDYHYIIENDEVTILSYIGDDPNPTIPSTIEGLPVTRIEVTAFNYSNIKSVTIQNGVTEIL